MVMPEMQTERTEESFGNLMDEIRDRLELFGKNLPKSVDGFALSQVSKLPWKVLVYRESLIWRMVELGRGAFENFENDKLVAAIVLTCVALETTAALWYLCAKVDTVVESKIVGDIDDDLMKMVVGIATTAPNADNSATEVVMPRPIKIKAFLKQVDRDIPGFSHQYGSLSEYAHPNWAGTSLLYSKDDTETGVTYFGQNIRGADNTKRIGVHNLIVALAMFERSYNRISELIPAFIKIIEGGVRNEDNQSPDE